MLFYETEKQFQKRISNAFEKLKTLVKTNKKFKTILVISHHGFIAEFSKNLNNGQPMFIDNCQHISFTLNSDHM